MKKVRENTPTPYEGIANSRTDGFPKNNSSAPESCSGNNRIPCIHRTIYCPFLSAAILFSLRLLTASGLFSVSQM